MPIQVDGKGRLAMAYTYGQAAEISGIATSRLRNWCHQGIAPLFGDHTPGRHRRFALRDVIGLAVMGEAIDRGLSRRGAAVHLARYAVFEVDDDVEIIRDRVIYVFENDDFWSFRSDPDPENGRRSGIVIYVGLIAQDVMERVRAFEDARQERARARTSPERRPG